MSENLHSLFNYYDATTQNHLLETYLNSVIIDKRSIKDPKLRLNLKYFWENWFQNCFFNRTGSKMELVPINRFEIEPV